MSQTIEPSARSLYTNSTPSQANPLPGGVPEGRGGSDPRNSHTTRSSRLLDRYTPTLPPHKQIPSQEGCPKGGVGQIPATHTQPKQTMVGQLQKLPVATPPATLETVAQFDGAMPTGVTVSHQGRIFVNFPKWGDDVQFTVAELRDGQPVPYPSLEFNQTQPDNLAAALVSVQSVVVDPLDRLWILDTGSPMFEPTKPGGPKLVCVDLSTDRVINTILFPPDVGFQWLNPTYRSAFIATAKAVRTDVNAQTIVPLFQTDPCPLTSDPCYTRGLGWKIPS